MLSFESHLGNACIGIAAAMSHIDTALKQWPPPVPTDQTRDQLVDADIAIEGVNEILFERRPYLEIDFDFEDEEADGLFNRLLAIENENADNLAGIEAAIVSLRVAINSLVGAASVLRRKRKSERRKYATILVFREALMGVESMLSSHAFAGIAPFDTADRLLAMM